MTNTERLRKHSKHTEEARKQAPKPSDEGHPLSKTFQINMEEYIFGKEKYDTRETKAETEYEEEPSTKLDRYKTECDDGDRTNEQRQRSQQLF